MEVRTLKALRRSLIQGCANPNWSSCSGWLGYGWGLGIMRMLSVQVQIEEYQHAVLRSIDIIIRLGMRS